MRVKELDWKNLSWTDFQLVCIQIAGYIYQDSNFYEYLKQGMRQNGIDLYNLDRKDGRKIAVQCKRMDSIAVGDLTKIVDEFLKGDKSTGMSSFIIATSADLQAKKMQSAISELVHLMKDQHNIEFECWDKSKLEADLKNLWNVVRHYFGQSVADGFCLPQLHTSPLDKLQSVAHFIPRKITLVQDGKTIMQGKVYSEKHLYELSSLLINKVLWSQPICIIADAYQGKTSYLQQTAYTLGYAGKRLIPLFLEVKQHTIQPIEELLQSLWGHWKTIPLLDMILFIDGLDEVPAELFLDMAKHIYEFSQKYRAVKVVISCRKPFYNSYGLSGKLIGFEVYELLPLRNAEISTYLNNRIGKEQKNFLAIIEQAEMLELLYHPFYLVNLTDDFIENPDVMPRTRLGIMQSAIERSTIKSLERQGRGGKLIRQKKVKFTSILTHFAFALQLAGKNSFTEDEMQQLFSEDDLDLLRHSPMITDQSYTWSLNNSLFLEHLAAAVLIKLEFEDIVKYSTVGTRFRKIKTKWIQTISSALSLLNYQHPIFQQIFQLLQDDSIELVFQTDSSKYSDEVKLLMVKKLIQRFSDSDRGPSIVYEDKIGDFIRESPACTDYILGCLVDPTKSDRVKISCCRILNHANLTEKQSQTYLSIFVEQFAITNSVPYISSLVNVLACQRLGDADLVATLVRQDQFNQDFLFRDSVYELIVNLGLVDAFFDYGITGATLLKNNQRNNSNHIQAYYLKTFLLATTQEEHLRKMLLNEDIIGCFINDSTDINSFAEELFEKLTIELEANLSLIVPIASFIRELSKDASMSKHSQIDVFLNESKLKWIVTRLLMLDILGEEGWQFGFLVDESSYDFILFELDQDTREYKKVIGDLLKLARFEKNSSDNVFYKLCYDATESSNYVSGDSKAYQRLMEVEHLKKENDLLHVQSIDNFRNALISYFEAHGSKSISYDDLEIEWKPREVRLRSISNILDAYLLMFAQGGTKTINLERCLTYLDNQGAFDHFVSSEIQNYRYSDPAVEVIMNNILNEYYQKTIVKCNFENCYRDADGKTFYRKLDVKIGEIFRKFRFKTEEKQLLDLIWLDAGGTRSMESSNVNKRNTISQEVIEQLSDSGRSKLRERIIENIKSGIKSFRVLGNHIALCGKLKIYEARPHILQILKNEAIDLTSKIDMVDIYILLNGNWSEVVDLYKNQKDFNDYFFTYLTSKLLHSHPAVIKYKGREVLVSEQTLLERKIRIAQLMAHCGCIEGLKFLIRSFNQHKFYEYFNQGYDISKIETAPILKELASISHFLIKTNVIIGDQYSNSAKSIISEWLNILGTKSEDDLNLVLNFLETEANRLGNVYGQIINFNRFEHNLLEAFRKTEHGSFGFAEIKGALLRIE